jgi:hypothetical protein
VLRYGHISFDTVFKSNSEVSRFCDDGVIGVVDSPRGYGKLAGIDIIAGAYLRKYREIPETRIAAGS